MPSREEVETQKQRWLELRVVQLGGEMVVGSIPVEICSGNGELMLDLAVMCGRKTTQGRRTRGPPIVDSTSTHLMAKGEDHRVRLAETSRGVTVVQQASTVVGC